MKFAADFKNSARESLVGKWKIAVLVGIVAAILGAVDNMGPDVKVNIDASGLNASFSFAGQTILSTNEGLNSGVSALLIGGFTYILVAALLLVAVYFVIGSVVKVGYAKFNLNLVDRVDASFDNLFAYFSNWKTTAAARFLTGMYVFLWMLLLIIPGIIASYSYAMTEYILADHPELSASEAISRSKEMMEGNRWRLFCLEFSFIGWSILCALTLGIGYLWLTPYKEAAKAAFYREISGTGYIVY